MNDEKRIANSFLLYGLEDIQDLGWMVQAVNRLTGIPRGTPEIVKPTLKGIRDLLECDYAFVGDTVRDEKGFTSVKSWGLSVDVSIARIEERWSEVKNPLRLPGIVWLELTEKGHQEATRLDEEGCDPWKEVPKRTDGRR